MALDTVFFAVSYRHRDDTPAVIAMGVYEDYDAAMRRINTHFDYKGPDFTGVWLRSDSHGLMWSLYEHGIVVAQVLAMYVNASDYMNLTSLIQESTS